MSVVRKIEDLLLSAKRDESVEKFQQEYIDLLSKGVIHRKGYDLPGVDVIGGKEPSLQGSNVSILAASFNE